MSRKRYRIECGKKYPGCYYYIIADGNGREIDRSYSITYYDENGNQRDALFSSLSIALTAGDKICFEANAVVGGSNLKGVNIIATGEE